MISNLKKAIRINIAVIVSSAVLCAVIANTIWINALDKYKADQKAYLGFVSQSASSMLDLNESLLLALGHQLFANKRRVASNSNLTALANVQTSSALIEYLLVLDNKGRVIVASPNLSKAQRTMIVIENSYVELRSLAVDEGKSIIGKTHSYESGVPVIPIATPVTDKNNKLLGVIFAGLNLSKLAVNNETTLFEHMYSAGILRGDGYWQIKLDSKHSGSYFDEMLQEREFTYLTSENTGKINNSLFAFLYKYIVTKQTPQSQKTQIYDNNTNSWYISEISTSNIVANALRQLLPACLLLIIFNIGVTYVIYKSYRNANNVIDQRAKQSMHDSLTTLPNGLYLRDVISNWMDSKGERQDFSLLYVDVDNFKSVNVSHGQEFGDQILKQVAERLNKLHHGDSLLIRQSGNGFVYVTKSTDQKVLNNFSQDILYALSVPFVVEKNTFLLGGSIGIAVYPQNGDTLDELLSAAELALREAKKTLNTALFFSHEMHENNRYRMRVEQKLRYAIKQNVPYVVYQPQLDSNGHLYGVEVLVRWTDEELGVVNPASFVAIAESSGLIVELGDLVLTKAFKELEKIQRKQNTKFQISLNISIRQFMHQGFVETLKSRINLYNLDPSYITVEITENLFIEDIEKMKPIFDELRAFSISISLDDFGTGYSSLSMLTEIVLDELKIDKNFVDNIHIDPQSLTMVKNIIAIGKNYNMTVLAEGVETIDQKEMLKRCGCDAFQGYFYSKPIMYYELEEYLKTFGGSANVVSLMRKH